MTIGDRLKKKRLECQISQTDLAAKVGITKQSLYKYEKGIITNIPSDVIEKLADALECSPAYIMGWNLQVDVTPKREELSPEIIAYATKLMELPPDVREKLMQMLEVLQDKKKGE